VIANGFFIDLKLVGSTNDGGFLKGSKLSESTNFLTADTERREFTYAMSSKVSE